MWLVYGSLQPPPMSILNHLCRTGRAGLVPTRLEPVLLTYAVQGLIPTVTYIMWYQNVKKKSKNVKLKLVGNVYFLFITTLAMLAACGKAVGRSVHHFGPERNISTTTGWIVMIFCADIHVNQRRNPNDFGDTLTFPPGPIKRFTFLFLNETSADIHRATGLNPIDVGDFSCSAAGRSKLSLIPVKYLNIYLIGWLQRPDGFPLEPPWSWHLQFWVKQWTEINLVIP